MSNVTNVFMRVVVEGNNTNVFIRGRMHENFWDAVKKLMDNRIKCFVSSNVKIEMIALEPRKYWTKRSRLAMKWKDLRRFKSFMHFGNCILIISPIPGNKICKLQEKKYFVISNVIGYRRQVFPGWWRSCELPPPTYRRLLWRCPSYRECPGPSLIHSRRSLQRLLSSRYREMNDPGMVVFHSVPFWCSEELYARLWFRVGIVILCHLLRRKKKVVAGYNNIIMPKSHLTL